MAIWAAIAIYGAIWSIQKLKNYLDKPLPEKAPPNGRPEKTVETGVPIPLFYGTVTITEPHIVYASPPVFLKKDISGCETWMQTVMMILGIPSQVGEATIDNGTWKVLQVWCNGKILERFIDTQWHKGPIVIDHGDDVLVNLPFFHGPKGQGGSLHGFISYEDGVHSSTDLGFDQVLEELGSDAVSQWPRYKKQAKILFWFPSAPPTPGGFRFGEANTLPNFMFLVRGRGGNPVHAIQDIITSDWGRVNLPTSSIDTASFDAAVSTLDGENHRYSNVINQAQPAREILEQIVTQIDAALFVEPITNKFVIKLIRDDFDPDDLLVLGPDQILDFMSYQVASWTGGYNTVRIEISTEPETFADQKLPPAAVSVFVQDMAAISGSTDGRSRSITIRHPGLRSLRTARVVAARTLQEVATPLATLRIKCTRDAAVLRPGDAFKLAWPEYNIAGQIFRVQHIDLGSLEDQAVVIDAIRDKFDVNAPLMGDDATVPDAPPLILPLEDRVVTEAPAWFVRSAAGHGITSVSDIGRGLFLAAPAQAESGGYAVRTFSNDLTRDESDLDSEVPYLAFATLSSNYSYSTEAYDTTVHLTVTASTDVAAGFFTATATEIRNGGKNLLLIDGEILAYESATALGGSSYRLNNVWRGLLDTVAADHESGAHVWLLSDSIGFRAWQYVGVHIDIGEFTPVNVQLFPRAFGQLISRAAFGVETDVLTPAYRGRALRPYPVADFEINSVKSTTLTEEGIVLTWKWRERTTGTIVRGDAANQALSADMLINNQIYVFRAPPFEVVGEQFLLNAKDGDGPSISDFLSASIAGTGQLKVIGRIKNVLSGSPGEENWQDAFVVINAPTWRNLIANPHFEFDLNQGWTVATGTILLGTDGTNRHGNTGRYLGSVVDGTGHPDVDISQIIRLDGWPPDNMTAHIEFYEHLKSSDISDPDEYTVTLTAHDEDDNVLNTASVGPNAGSSVWNIHSTGMTIPVDTKYLKVRIQLEAVEEDFPEPDVTVADLKLSVGQFTGNNISNGDFPGGSLTGWTTATGNFTTENKGINAYEGSYVARGGTSATNEIYTETAAITAGYTVNTTAVLDWAQDNDTSDTGDKGQVILEARDSGGAVLASVSTTAEQLTPTDVWYRRQLTLDPPIGTDHFRVRLIATRTAGSGTCNACFDDLHLVYHKHLEMDARDDADFREPNEQKLPRDRTEWPEAFPTVAIPDYGMWEGSETNGQIGIEPTLDATQLRLGKFLGCWDAERGSAITTAFEFHPTDTGLTTGDADFNYGNFRTEDSFTVVCFVRKRTRVEAAYGIVGRLDGHAGWALQLSAGGQAQAFLRGDAGTASVTRSTSLSDGAPHLVAIIYNAGTNTLTVCDEFGNSSTSTAGVGDIQSTFLPPFCIGKASTSQSCLPGQIARCWIWRSALSTSDVAALWTHGQLAGDMPIGTYTSPGALCARAGTDALGELYASWGSAQVPQFTEPLFSYFGVPLPVAVTNLVSQLDLTDTSTWIRDSANITEGQLSPTGFYDGLQIADANVNGLHVGVTTTNANAVNVVWFARATAAVNARMTLKNGSGVNKGTHDYAVTTSWQRFTHRFTGWDFSTAAARVDFFASDSGTTHTFQIAGPILITQDMQEVPVAIPYKGGASTAASLTLTPTMPIGYNHEGSLIAAGLSLETAPATRDIITVDNSTNNNDKRVLVTSGRFQHYDGSGSANNSDATPGGWSDPFAISARWNRAGLLDDATTKYAGVFFSSSTPTYGRTSSWSASTTVAINRITLHGSNLVIFWILLTSRETRIVNGIPTLPELP
jgi:hypothetical protein